MRALISRLQRSHIHRRVSGLAAFAAVGCSTPGERAPVPVTANVSALRSTARGGPHDPVQLASFQTSASPGQDARPILARAADLPGFTPVAGVDDLVRLAIERNPRIARATIAVDAAQGRYVQAGLYPNPDLGFYWDEIGDRTSIGGSGIITAPRVSQTIVTGHKLSLAQAVVAREVDQATLDLLGERYSVIGSVRATFFEVYALQQRLDILRELVRLAEQGVAQGRTLVENQRLARLDLIQLEVELERFRTEARAVERELPAEYRRLAAVTGDPRLPLDRLAGPFDDPPNYDLGATRETVLAFHPQARSARVGVSRAQTAVRQAEAQPIPNVTVTGGYIRQFENRSYDGAFGLSAPIPVWNLNQGNIRTAKAELGMAIQNVGRVENDLAERVAAAFRTYAAARERAERYRSQIIPRAEETYRLSLDAFKGGQFEYLRFIQAQRAVAEARLERNRALGEAWRAAAELSGLLLEEAWPSPAPDPATGSTVPPPPGAAGQPEPR